MPFRPCGARKNVVEPQSDVHREAAESPAVVNGKKKPDRTHQMRRGAMAQAFAFAQRMIHEGELPLRQVAKSAVNELRGSPGSRTREIARLDQRHAESAQRGVTRDRGSVDAAADDAQIEFLARHPRQAFFPRKTGGRRRGQSASSW